MGNLPPRDVLAKASADEVKQATIDMIDALENKSRILLSCGGGMPPGVKSENIQAFLDAVNEVSGK